MLPEKRVLSFVKESRKVVRTPEVGVESLHQPAMSAEDAGALSGVMAVVDGGNAPGGTASTVLDLTGPEPHVLREGAIPTPELLGPPPPRTG